MGIFFNDRNAYNYGLKGINLTRMVRLRMTFCKFWGTFALQSVSWKSSGKIYEIDVNEVAEMGRRCKRYAFIKEKLSFYDVKDMLLEG